MLTGFTTKQIKAKQSLGERLKARRLELEISLTDAEIGSRVRAEYLESLEKDDWATLPSDVYIRGFVIAYAKFLGVDRDEIESLFRTEQTIKNRQKKNSFIYEHSIKDIKVLITPKLLGYLVLGFFVFSMFGYIIYQVGSFVGAPSLKVILPTNNSVVESDSLEVRGLTDNDNALSVNSEKIPITEDGHFATTLKLRRGLNVIKIKAVNKTKKESVEVLTIEYKPKTASVNPMDQSN